MKNKIAFLSPNISLITLNINGLNTAIIKRMGKVDFKNDPTTCYLQETPFKYNDICG